MASKAHEDGMAYMDIKNTYGVNGCVAQHLRKDSYLSYAHKVSETCKRTMNKTYIVKELTI